MKSDHDALIERLNDPIGKVCPPIEGRPYKHFVRLREPHNDEIGYDLYALTTSEAAALASQQERIADLSQHRRIRDRMRSERDSLQASFDSVLARAERAEAALRQAEANVTALLSALETLYEETDGRMDDSEITAETRTAFIKSRAAIDAAQGAKDGTK